MVDENDNIDDYDLHEEKYHDMRIIIISETDLGHENRKGFQRRK